MRRHVQITESMNNADASEFHFPGEPDLAILWAAAWTGSTVRCLFHHERRANCAVCSGSQDWRLLHRTVASLSELLNSQAASGATRMVVLIREREMQLTAIAEDGPLITMAIPPGPDVVAAQAWMERWAALKVPPRHDGNVAGS